MAKKTTNKKVVNKSLPKGVKGCYHKDGIFLNSDDKFVYEMIVYEFMDNGVSLADLKKTSIKEFKGFGAVNIIEKGKKRYMRNIDLISAPVKFLLENNFKLIE